MIKTRNILDDFHERTNGFSHFVGILWHCDRNTGGLTSSGNPGGLTSSGNPGGLTSSGNYLQREPWGPDLQREPWGPDLQRELLYHHHLHLHSLLYDQTELEDPLPDELDEPLAPSGVHNMRSGMDVPKPDDLAPATTAGIVLAAVIGTCVVAVAMCMWMCPDWRADLARVVPLSLV